MGQQNSDSFEAEENALQLQNRDLRLEIEQLRAREAQLSQQLQRSQNDLQSFISVASHDLKEPLRKIGTFGSRLENNIGVTLDERNLFYLQRMRDGARRLDAHLDALLLVSRVNTQGRPFVAVDLAKIAQETTEVFRKEIESCGASIECENLPRVQADERQMHQLLRHLIGNALQSRRRDAALEIRIYGWSEGASRGFSIADNGQGFESRDAERIFEIFARGDRHTREAVGVGLTICRRIVERHGGSLTATGEVGQGATFRIEWPAP
jgi:signal transduction histidine kinase